MTTLTTSTQIANLALALCGVTKQLTTLGSDGTTEDDVANLFYAPTRDELIELYPWAEYLEHRPLVLTAGYYEFNQEYAYDPISITGITNANPAVVTSGTHSFVTGDYVYIYDVSGMTEVNRDLPFHITKVLATTFQLTGIDSTNWTAYSSGGKCYKAEPLSKYQDGFVYDLPSDFAYAIDLDSSHDFELKGIAGAVKLLTVADDAVLKYIKTDFADISKWTSLFINAFVSRLAIKLAIPIVGTREGSLLIRNILQPMYDQALNDAMYLCAVNKRQTRETKDPWIIARGGV